MGGGNYTFWLGASAEEADPALVASDQAASRLAPTGVDPLRGIPYKEWRKLILRPGAEL